MTKRRRERSERKGKKKTKSGVVNRVLSRLEGSPSVCDSASFCYRIHLLYPPYLSSLSFYGIFVSFPSSKSMKLKLPPYHRN